MPQIITRLLHKKSWPYLFIFGCSMIANVFSFAYNMLLNRILTLDQFSQIGSVLNSFIVTSGMAMALQYTATKYMPTVWGDIFGKTKTFINTQITYSLIIGITLSILAALSIPWWTQYLHLTLPTSVYFILASTFVVFMVLASIRGLLLGKQWYYPAGITLLSENISKFVFILIGLVLGAPFLTSFIAIPAAMFFAFIVATVLLTSYAKWRFYPTLNSHWVRQISRFAAYSLLLTMSAQLLLFTDVILVRHYFDPESAGVYSTLSLIGKIIYFFITSILMILTPEVSVRLAAQKASHSILIKSSVFAVTVGTLSTIVLRYFPHLTINLVLDPVKVTAALPYIGPYGIAATLISIVVVMSTYFLFSGYKRFSLLIFMSLAVQVLLINQFHQNISQVITIMIVMSASLVILIPFAAALERRGQTVKVLVAPLINSLSTP